MASNREERRLMRQRGAANRQIKEVDFGFSFGSPKFEGPQEPAQRATPPTFEPSAQYLSQADTTPNSRLSVPSIPLSQRSPTRDGSQGSSVRTPGSSRNLLSERSSVFDIPRDDEPGQGSPKRRKISAVHTTHEESLRLVSVRTNTEASGAATQRSQESTHTRAVDSISHPDPTNPTKSPNLPQSSSPRRHSLSQKAPEELPGNNQNKQNNENIVENGTSQSRPPQNRQRRKKKKKPVVLKPQKSRKSLANAPQRLPEVPHQEVDQTAEEEQQDNQVDDQPEEPVHQPPQAEKSTKPNSQKRKSAGQTNTRQRTRAVSPQQQSSQKLGGREYREGGAANRVTGEGHQDDDETSAETQAPVVVENATEEVDNHTEEEPQQEAEDEGSERDAVQESSERQQKGKRPRQQRRDTEHIDTGVTQTAPEPEPQSTNKKQSKRKSRTGGPQQGSTKERKSRGDTVPVVVHRLTNLSALDVDLDEEYVDASRPSGDVSANHQYPNRSGANAADVLSQICSETLDKTMATLDNSISQESNPTRRAEWTGKRKAVEAFSTELGNRLFEMSEMMESNFVMTAQLKREKKEMATLRGQLMDVRKERGDIALRIDDVRRQYAEDEKAKMGQDTLNNALHDLQLALDRSHKGKDDKAESNPFVGLEFLLRTVAQDISSVAPDSHGGLLSQVRNFNDKLERAASMLEQKR